MQFSVVTQLTGLYFFGRRINFTTIQVVNGRCIVFRKNLLKNLIHRLLPGNIFVFKLQGSKVILS